ncbi:MAG: C-type lectin domain-containing protein [Candidatus Zixiibacteriota bacterium]
MRLLLTTFLGLSLFISNISAQSLMNLIQWQESDGGNGHWYAIMSEQYHWSDAVAAAATLASIEGREAHLATITSYNENQFIFENLVYNSMAPLYGDQAWLGGYDAGGGNWQWITDESFDYTNWAPDEPNNPGSELSMSMWDLDTDPEKPNQVPGMWNNSLAEDRDWWSIVEWGDAPDLHPPAIPEPSTILLLALGLGTLVIRKFYSE